MCCDQKCAKGAKGNTGVCSFVLFGNIKHGMWKINRDVKQVWGLGFFCLMVVVNTDGQENIQSCLVCWTFGLTKRCRAMRTNLLIRVQGRVVSKNGMRFWR